MLVLKQQNPEPGSEHFLLSKAFLFSKALEEKVL